MELQKVEQADFTEGWEVGCKSSIGLESLVPK